MKTIVFAVPTDKLHRIRETSGGKKIKLLEHDWDVECVCRNSRGTVFHASTTVDAIEAAKVKYLAAKQQITIH